MTHVNSFSDEEFQFSLWDSSMVRSSLLVIQENSTANLYPFSYAYIFLKVNFYKTTSETAMPVLGEVEGRTFFFGRGGSISSMFGLMFPRITPQSVKNALATISLETSDVT